MGEYWDFSSIFNFSIREKGSLFCIYFMQKEHITAG
jgi:hypothetical protein